MAVEGLITLRSNYGPKDTMDRLEAAVKPRARPYSPMSTTRRKPESH